MARFFAGLFNAAFNTEECTWALPGALRKLHFTGSQNDHGHIMMTILRGKIKSRKTIIIRHIQINALDEQVANSLRISTFCGAP